MWGRLVFLLFDVFIGFGINRFITNHSADLRCGIVIIMDKTWVIFVDSESSFEIFIIQASDEIFICWGRVGAHTELTNAFKKGGHFEEKVNFEVEIGGN